MPFVRIQLIEGRKKEDKEKIAKEIIEVMDKNDFAKAKDIHIIYEEMKLENYYIDEEK